MTETEFTNWIPTILTLTAVCSFLQAINSLLFFTIVERKGSKILCVFGFIVFSAMTIFRINTAVIPEDYFVRFVNAWIIVFGGFVAVGIFFWSFWVQRRERLKRHRAEQKIVEITLSEIAGQSLRKINPDRAIDWIFALHPDDAQTLAKKYINQH